MNVESQGGLVEAIVEIIGEIETLLHPIAVAHEVLLQRRGGTKFIRVLQFESLQFFLNIHSLDKNY